MLPSLSAPGTPFPELCGCMEMPQGIRDTATTTKGFQGVEGKDISTSLGGWARERVPSLPPAP